MLVTVFLVITALLFLLILLGNLFIFDKKHPVIVGRYATVITVFIVLYCISAFFLLFKGGAVNRLVIGFLLLSPFIIGKLVTYKTIKIFTFVQLLVLVLGYGYVYYRF